MTSPVPTPEGPLVVPASAPAGHGESGPIRLSLVIPSYNEAENVAPLVAELDRLLAPVLGEAYELIVVDDDSPDRTWEVALGLCAKHPRLRVMRRVGERGLSTAVVRGWQVARGELLGVMDADLQHPPAANLGLLREMDRGASLAVASRHVEGGGVSDWSMARRALSRGAQMLGLLVLPDVVARLSDPMSGYFMVRRAAIAGRPLDPLGYKILIEVVARGDARWIGETGYVFRERAEGRSKVTWNVYAQYLAHLLKLRLARSARFIRFATVGGSGVVVDMSILYLLSDPGTLGLGLTPSKVAAAGTAIQVNFLLNDAWTFADRARREGGLRARLRRLLSFNAICSLGLVLNVLVLNALVDLGGLNRYLANLIAIGTVAVWNYLLNSRLNWTPLLVSTDEPPEAGGAPDADRVRDRRPRD